MEDYKKKYEKLHKNTLTALQKRVSEGKITEEIARSICADFIKESEDERIRKNLREFLLDAPSQDIVSHHLDLEETLNWLEKQGEQKEINLVEILKHYPRETELYSPLYGKLWLAEVDEEHKIITCYKYQLENGCTRAVIEQEDTVSFYSNGTTVLPDCSITKDCMLFLYNNEKQVEQKPVDKVEPEEDVELTDFESALFSAFSDAWQEYLRGEEVNVAKWAREHSAELLEVAREHNPAWSEDDERILIKIQDHLREFYVDKKGYPYVAKFNSPEMVEFNWLKSVKERMKGE